MTTDRYTKAVLTVIALSVSVIAIQLSTKDAHAQTQGFKFAQSGALIVSICDSKGNGVGVYCAEVDKLERK
jgi:hypothetical protein